MSAARSEQQIILLISEMKYSGMNQYSLQCPLKHTEILSENQYIKLSNRQPKAKISGLIIGELSLQGRQVLQMAITVWASPLHLLHPPSSLCTESISSGIFSTGLVLSIFPALSAQELLLPSPLPSGMWHGPFCSQESSRTCNPKPLLGRVPLIHMGPADKRGHSSLLLNPFVSHRIIPQPCMM